MALKFWKKKQLKKTLSTLRKKCSYLEFFWYAFFSIWTEYGDLLRKSPHSTQMRQYTDQENAEYGNFWLSGTEKHWHEMGFRALGKIPVPD